MEMSSTSIEKSEVLRASEIEPDHYTLSILQEGNYAGLIDEPTMTLVQIEIMSLLKEILIRYNHGESSSFKTETAESILTSILYSIDAQLLCLSPEDALNSLLAGNVKNIYEEGLDLVSSCLVETKLLYRHIANSTLNVDLYAYNSTINEALPEFFAIYDPVYKAQDTWASMDYPLLFDDLKGTGIYYIRQYLENLSIENYFCSLFDPRAVEKLLNNYGKVYRIDYRETLINILEIVLTNCIFSVMAGNSAIELDISQYQYTLLEKKLKDADYTNSTHLINTAINTLIEELHIDDFRVSDYIRRYQSLLMPRFFSALENDNLTNIIIIDRNESRQLDIIWDEGNNLIDDDFRLMVEQILGCTTASEKAVIINSTIHSLGDFIDLLEADCLFDTEYYTLFSTLGDVELSILMQIVFAEELRVGGVDNLLQITDSTQFEMSWQVEYVKFLRSLSPERIKAIKYFIPK